MPLAKEIHIVLRACAQVSYNHRSRPSNSIQSALASHMQPRNQGAPQPVAEPLPTALHVLHADPSARFRTRPEANPGSDCDLRTLAQHLGLRLVEDLNGRQPSAQFLQQIPIAFAREHGVLGLAGSDERLEIVLCKASSWQQVDTVSRFLRQPVTVFLAPEAEIQRAINTAYQQVSGQAQQLIAWFDRSSLLAELEQLDSHEDLLDSEGRAPVIRLVSLILFEAVQSLASDVHVQPYEARMVVRLRIDGVLFDAFDVPKQLQDEVISRIKVIGKMNIAEKRLPQDGRATVEVGDRLVDLRIASMPTSHGERVVIRLLDKGIRLYSLAEIGMDPFTLSRFQELIQLEHGLILATGPTGSGKSTTLYAALQQINAKDRNVVTLEDPIEYQLDGVSQTQINTKKGMTFASGLRSVLRQDPDIIMVGEIRDHETAVMAIQSALTGHLVFSTLHTNDAASAVTRLLDLGIEPYLVASSVIAVLAQRLVRRICSECCEEYEPEAEELRCLGLDWNSLPQGRAWRGRGCSKCRETGYQGRVGLFELLVADEVVRKRVQKRDSASRIRDAAAAGGMLLLRDDGLEKIAQGKTTVEEVIRVTMRATL